MTLRRKITAALCGAAPVVGLTAVAPSALAAPVPPTHSSAANALKRAAPDAAEGCNGDICMYLNTPSNNKSSAHAWLYSTTYGGYFVFTGPGGLSEQSSTQTWYGGGTYGTGYYTPSFTAVIGTYCFQFFQVVNGKAISQGKPCENIE
jgi:hypothetical protein